jgi:hypothetical protein
MPFAAKDGDLAFLSVPRRVAGALQ